jgi:cytochrome c-type biogenesis protein
MSALVAVAFGAGMLSTVNPCGFAMLPAFLAYYLGTHSGERSGGTTGRLIEGLRAGLALTAGFAGALTAVGLLVTLGLRVLLDAVPWLAVLLGGGLAVAGVAMLAGRSLHLRLPARQVGLPADGMGRLVAFGVAYALASLSCTLAVLLSVVTQALAARDVVGVLAVFAAYALGASTVLLLLAVSSAFTSQAVARGIRRVLPYVGRIAGAVLALAGLYLVSYWAPVLGGGIPGGPLGRPVGRAAAGVSMWVSAHTAAVAAAALVAVTAAAAAMVLNRARAVRRNPEAEEVAAEPDIADLPRQ